MKKDAIIRAFNYIIHGVPTTYVNVTVKEYNEKRLLGRKILITGGGRGIGFWIAHKCIAEGAQVLICGRNEDTLKEAKLKLGDNCHYRRFDVSKVSAMPQFLDDAFAEMGGIDSLVNNAGISLHEGTFRNVTEEGFDVQFSTNLKAPYFFSKYFIEKVEKENIEKANILFITSERGSFNTTIPYGLTKASLKSYVGALSHYLCGKANIRVNALAPGVTASEMTGNSIDGNYFSENSPNRRIYHPSEMANVACFLLSDESSCISGETVHCDSGRHHKVIN